MTYLNGPRLHFAGKFVADVSTVNNTVTHFRDPDDPEKPGWNPGGSGRWALADCKVTRAVYEDGTTAQTAAEDPVIGLALSHVDRAVIVDLDPEQQMVSQIWGLRMQLGSPGTPAFRGAFKTTAFSDIWPFRAPSGAGGDADITAFYHSVLTGVAWGDVAGSRLLSELQQNSDTDVLSIKFNLDGFDQTRHVGRIVGTIGPARAGEPAHFVRGRHCMVGVAGPVWYFPALVDAERGKLVADFGNALQTTSSGGPFDSSLDLRIGTFAGDAFAELGKVPIGGANWYEQTAGVCDFPADRRLTAAELARLESEPIGVQARDGDATGLAAHEGVGIHVRADDFVYRLSANERVTVTLHVTRFGQPVPDTRIDLGMDTSELQFGDIHPLAEPADGLTFPASVTTDASGTALLELCAGSIDRPRDYIDGQLYGARYSVDGPDPGEGGYANRWNCISALVWTDYHAPAEPAWKQDVEPILSEYAQLYSVMKDILDLADYQSVVDNKDGLERVFNLPQDNPHYMPVTRDLSPAKRQMILAWLQTTGNIGQPNLDNGHGAAPTGAPTPAAASGPVTELGGKTAALERIRAHRH